MLSFIDFERQPLLKAKDAGYVWTNLVLPTKPVASEPPLTDVVSQYALGFRVGLSQSSLALLVFASKVGILLNLPLRGGRSPVSLHGGRIGWEGARHLCQATPGKQMSPPSTRLLWFGRSISAYRIRGLRLPGCGLRNLVPGMRHPPARRACRRCRECLIRTASWSRCRIDARLSAA